LNALVKISGFAKRLTSDPTTIIVTAHHERPLVHDLRRG
jgi:hypothetical protein